MAQRSRETFGNHSLEEWDYMCSGGFGLVYMANHKDMGIKVVIKLLDADDGSMYAALCREADYMAASDHQYVPRVFGMYRGSVPGLGSKERHGIVMELMEGGSLQSFLKTQSKPPPWPLAFRLAHQVALAMDFLHSKKDLVHMDLKAANILLDANLNAKIADFGLSTVSNSVKSTNGENKGGTIAYTPPEAFGYNYRRVRSYDAYSYGILLWTILTGESPYPGVDPSLLRFRIEMGDRPDLHKIDVQKATGLEELVDLMKRCWHPEPKKRPSFEECVEVTRRVFSIHEEGIDAAVCDISKQLNKDPKDLEVPPGCRDRGVFLKHSSPLSLDPNTAYRKLILSEDNRMATFTHQLQHYPEHPERFTYYPNVLSKESLSGRYFEVEWSGECVSIAISYKDTIRQGEGLSAYGLNDKTWVLGFGRWGSDDAKSYVFDHKSIRTAVSGPAPSTGRNRVGVFVDHTSGVLCFYSVDVDSNTMILLHEVRTTFKQPLYLGLAVLGTGEVCKIW